MKQRRPSDEGKNILQSFRICIFLPAVIAQSGGAAADLLDKPMPHKIAQVGQYFKLDGNTNALLRPRAGLQTEKTACILWIQQPTGSLRKPL
jgi:hypothetical protein